jgi:tetratricopeptide (TPR) repeat protein
MSSVMHAPPVSPAAVEALYATGHWLYTQRRFADAVTVFRAMVHVAPLDERGWLALGTTHQAQDEDDTALELYEAAIRMTRRAPRCQLARARILRQRGLHGQALDIAAEAARDAGDQGDDELLAIIAAEWGER